MNDTKFYWDKKTDETRFAKWHTETGELYPFKKHTAANGADDILTTIEDYSKFMVYIMQGADLSEELQQEMLKNQSRINENQYFGLGWYIDENINANNDYAIIHGGDDIGVHTIAFIVPKTKQGLLIFTNSDNGTDAFQEILLKYLGENGQGILEVEMKLR